MKPAPGEYCLIHDLSFPKDNSVNSHIPKTYTEVQYELLDDCISIICSLGQNCLIVKAYIKDAFRIIPIHPDDYMVFWVSLDKINFIMTGVSPWAVAHPARLLNLSPLLCSGFSHLHKVCEICHTY